MGKKKENNYIHTKKGSEIISHNLNKKFGVLKEVFINNKWYIQGLQSNKYHTIRRANQAKENLELNQNRIESKFEYRFTVVILEYNLNYYGVKFRQLEIEDLNDDTLKSN